MNQIHIPLIITLIALTSGILHAQVGFDFNDLNTGDIDSQDSWTVAGDNGTTAEVVSGGLTFSSGDFDIDGGSQAVKIVGGTTDTDDASSDALGRSFSSVNSGGGDVYFSFLARPNGGLPVFGNTGLSGAGFSKKSAGSFAWAGNDGANRVRAWDDTNNTVNYTNTEINPAQSDADSTSFIVGRITSSGNNGSNLDTVEFTINPSSFVESTNTWTAAGEKDTGVEELDYFGTFINKDGGDITLDEISIADNFNAVAVPEPGAYALFVGAITTGIVMFKRNRDKKLLRS